MNVGQLKKLLADAPDNALVVIEGMDHSYITAHPGMATAIFNREYGEYTQDWGNAGPELTGDDVRVDVLLIS